MRIAHSGLRVGFDRPKATDGRSKKREVTKATEVTEAVESKATSKATAAIETTQTNSAICYNAAMF